MNSALLGRAKKHNFYVTFINPTHFMMQSLTAIYGHIPIHRAMNGIFGIISIQSLCGKHFT